MQPDSPAIKGGCVTRRGHPGTNPGTLAANLSRCKLACQFTCQRHGRQGGYGVVFAIMVQILLGAGAIALQIL